MKAIYVRISTPNQKLERHLRNDGKLFIDICSGSVKFMERQGAIDLVNHVVKNQIKCIQVNAIDRLGRNMVDVLNTLEFFTEKGIDIYIENLGFHTFINEKPNPMATIFFALMGNIAQMERENLKERTKDGIIVARSKGTYIPKGRPRGAVNKKAGIIVKYGKQISFATDMLEAGKSINEISKELNEIPELKINRATLTKLKNMDLLKRS